VEGLGARLAEHLTWSGVIPWRAPTPRGGEGGAALRVRVHSLHSEVHGLVPVRNGLEIRNEAERPSRADCFSAAAQRSSTNLFGDLASIACWRV